MKSCRPTHTLATVKLICRGLTCCSVRSVEKKTHESILVQQAGKQISWLRENKVKIKFPKNSKQMCVATYINTYKYASYNNGRGICLKMFFDELSCFFCYCYVCYCYAERRRLRARIGGGSTSKVMDSLWKDWGSSKFPCCVHNYVNKFEYLCICQSFSYR